MTSIHIARRLSIQIGLIAVFGLGIVGGCCNCTLYIQYRGRGYVPSMFMRVIEDSIAMPRTIFVDNADTNYLTVANIPSHWNAYLKDHDSMRVVIRTTHRGIDTLTLYPWSCDSTIIYDLGDRELKVID